MLVSFEITLASSTSKILLPSCLLRGIPLHYVKASIFIRELITDHSKPWTCFFHCNLPDPNIMWQLIYIFDIIYCYASFFLWHWKLPARKNYILAPRMTEWKQSLPMCSPSSLAPVDHPGLLCKQINCLNLWDFRLLEYLTLNEVSWNKLGRRITVKKYILVLPQRTPQQTVDTKSINNYFRCLLTIRRTCHMNCFLKDGWCASMFFTWEVKNRRNLRLWWRSKLYELHWGCAWASTLLRLCWS